MVGGVLYTAAGGQRVVAAIDAATGRQLWMWMGMDEGGRDRKAPRRNAGRGVAYWTDGREERIFVVTTGFYLVALDAKTGVPVPSFGANGAVDLMKELNVEFDHVTRIGNSSPPMVYKNTVIVPPALEEGFIPDSMRNTPGYVMAFDAHSGKQKWAFHTVPQDWRVWGGDVGGRVQSVHRQHRRVGAHLGRSRARLRLSSGGNPHRRLLWRPPAGQRSVRQFRRLRRSRDRQTDLALPDHAPRHMELRSPVCSGAGEHDGRRQAGQSARAADEAGIRLCARSRNRAAGLAVRGAACTGERCARRTRVADAAASHQATGVRIPGIRRERSHRLHAGATGCRH